MKIFRRIIIALNFLTIIPLPKAKEPNQEELGRSMAYFPLVGIFLGLFLACAYMEFARLLPSLLTAVLVTGLWACITGFLHLEGFVDAADGFSASQDKNKILEVMKDHHCGAKGVIALSFLVILKIALVYDMPGHARIAALILAPAIGRWVMTYAASMCPYARKGEGFGKAFVENVRHKELVIASAIVAIAGLCLLQVKFIILIIPILIFTFLSCLYLKKKIGGVTGDVLGAMNELAEIVGLGTFIFLR